MRPALTRCTAVLATAAALLLGAVPAASAHDRLESSVPDDGSSVATAPDAVTLGFGEAPIDLGLQVVVTGPDGAVVSQGSPQVLGADVVQGLGSSRPAGTYTVDWRVTSADGHPIEGRLAFTATDAVEPTPTPTPTLSGVVATPAATPAADDATPAPADADAGARSTGSWVSIIAAGLAGAALGVVLVRARRRSQRP